MPSQRTCQDQQGKARCDECVRHGGPLALLGSFIGRALLRFGKTTMPGRPA